MGWLLEAKISIHAQPTIPVVVYLPQPVDKFCPIPSYSEGFGRTSRGAGTSFGGGIRNRFRPAGEWRG